MSVDVRYRSLITALRELVHAEPDKIVQLLAVILAGKPFRPFLERKDLLDKAVAMARRYVAERVQLTTITTGTGADVRTDPTVRQAS
jgi:hypothetical protein